MKSAWSILIVSAITDFVITGGTAYTAATANGVELGQQALIAILIGGGVAAARTVQQALKATPENSAELKGEPLPKENK